MTTLAPQFLKHKVAIVTGGGRGIGEAIALALAQAGARVAITARTKTEVDAVAAKVHGLGGEALPIAADVANKADATRIVTETQKRFGRVDLLVNNAGLVGWVGPMADANVDEWIQAIQVNVIGTFLCCRAVLPLMIAQKSGTIINLSGGGGASASPLMSAYATSKAGLVRFTETLAEEVKEHNIQVNSLQPGAVRTKMMDDVVDGRERAGAPNQRMKNMRETGEGTVPASVAASLVVWLASPAAGKLTGKLINAPTDDWEQWDEKRVEELMAKPWLTLRRMDSSTLKTFL